MVVTAVMGVDGQTDVSAQGEGVLERSLVGNGLLVVKAGYLASHACSHGDDEETGRSTVDCVFFFPCRAPHLAFFWTVTIE